MKLKNNWKLIVFTLLLIIGVGYAALSETLKIAGTSGVKSNKWIIYFDNIKNESGVVSTNTKITEDKQEVDFNITLNKPGDYYEFDVDTVNDGTIDAMIDSAEFGELDDLVKDLVTFDVTYKDGTKIKKCDTLPKELRKTITVKVNYKDDITEKDLLNEDKSLNLTFTINYVQNSVCESYPEVIVDPNGGTYNGSNKLTKIKTDKNSDNLLDEPTREGYKFLYFKTESGTQLEKDENGKTNVHVEEDDIKVIAEWQEDNTSKYTVTIDPDGGTYKGQKGLITTSQNEGDVVTLEEPTRENYIFAGWEEITETNSLNNNVITVPDLNVTVKAVWKTEADYVARINTKYYETIQKAFDAAVDGDTVHLLKSTTENGNNSKNISFNLGGFTVTGTITNSGTLTIDNGRISNTESSPFINTGTVNVGTKDGNMIADSIVIFGGENVNGLTQNGTFNFYDGYIEGKQAVTSGYNELEEGYYYIVDHDDDNNCQKAYLSPNIDAIVMLKINNNPIYFKLLQDAIDMTTNDNPNIYAIKNFETSKAVVISSNQKVIFDICGYTILEGAQITNNGEFTIVDTKEEKGVFSPSLPIVNNNKLNITNAALTQSTTAGNLIENSGDLNITNSTLTANNGYTLDIKTGGTLVFDENTTITANSYGIYNEAADPVTITGGNIVKIYNNGASLTINNSNILRKQYYDTTIYSSKGDLTLNNVSIPSTYLAINCVTGANNLTINGGMFNSDSTTVSSAGNKVTIKNVEITSLYNAINLTNSETIIENSTINMSNTSPSASAIINNSNLTIKNSNIISGAIGITNRNNTLTINEGTIITGGSTGINNSSSGTVVINDGTITGKQNYGIEHSSRNKTIINGGTIISENNSGILRKSYTVEVNGGTIIGKKYGIELKYDYWYNTPVLIGNKDDELNVGSPIIIGELYGAYIEAGAAVEFYGGTLYGKTKGYSGDFTKIREKHRIVEDTDNYNSETYNTAYLEEQKKFIEVGDTKYNSLQDAIDAVDDTNKTMKLIDDAVISEEGIINNNKQVIFDLNGKKIINTDQIINNGELTVLDNSSTKDGMVKYTGVAGNSANFINNGKINIKAGVFESGKNIIKSNSNNSEVIIDGGSFTSPMEIINVSSALLTINDGTFETTTKASTVYAYSNSATYKTTINGGTFINNTNTSEAVAFLPQNNTTINGGTFISDKGKALSISASNILVENAVCQSNIGYAVNYSGGETVIINNMTATSTSSYALYVNTRDFSSWNLTITGGTYTSENSSGMYIDGYGVNIANGTFIGKQYGIDAYGGGRINIGVKNDTVLTTSPVAIGEKSGININEASINFYDGIFKGKESSYTNYFSLLPDEYTIEKGSEIIDGDTYETATLKKQEPFLQVGTKTYSSLKKAIANIEQQGTIEVIGNGYIGEDAEIPLGKNIIIDLKGHEIYISSTITNKGTLTLKDSLDSDGTIIGLNKNKTFINESNLTIESGNYVFNVTNFLSSLFYQTNATSTMTVDGGNIESTDNANAIELASGSLVVNDGNIKAKRTAIYIGSNVTIEVNGGTITSTDYSAIDNQYYSSNKTITLNGGKIESENGSAISVSATVNMNGGEVVAKNQALSVSGSLTITGGTVKSTNGYGIYMYGTNLTLGANDGAISSTTPVIEGKSYGIYGSNFNFYDGIIKGETDAFSGTTSVFANDSTIVYDTETVDDVTKQVAYLVPETELVKNKTTGSVYKNFQKAMNEVNDNDELVMIDDATLYSELSIPNKKFTLDLNSHKIDFIKQAVNDGNVTILDNSTDKKGTLTTSKGITVIKSNNKLSLNDISIMSENSYSFVENYGELSADNLNIEVSGNVFKNFENATLKFKNSNVNTNGRLSYVVNNNNGNVELYNNIVNFEWANGYLYNYEGAFSIEKGTVTSNSATSVYNNGKVDDVYNTIKDITFTKGKIENLGNLNISNVNLNTDAVVVNESNGNMTMTDINQTSISLVTCVDNSGTISLNDYTINGESGTLINNTGTAELNNFTGKLIGTTYYNVKYGIKNSGTLSFNSGSIKITKGDAGYGVYNTSGSLTIPNATIELDDSVNAYGIYITNGEVTLGVDENPAVVSTTSPLVSAIGTTSGIGVKKLDGTFNYYDGIITGSLDAKPEAPTDIPTRYRVIFNTDSNNYQNCILEYVP